MKKVIYIIAFGLLVCFSSCTVDYWENLDFVYTNNSNHTIEIKGNKSYNQTWSVLLLEKNESANQIIQIDPGVFHPSLGNDTIIVIYDNSITIQHGVIYTDTVRLKKDLYLERSYKITKTGKHHKSYEYTFTDADYEEALLLHKSKQKNK